LLGALSYTTVWLSADDVGSGACWLAVCRWASVSHLIPAVITAWHSPPMGDSPKRAPDWLLVDLAILVIGLLLIAVGCWLGVGS
jgi:hypothetical protein